jgi:hypothetical protein
MVDVSFSLFSKLSRSARYDDVKFSAVSRRRTAEYK